jgi:hypothetical protein
VDRCHLYLPLVDSSGTTYPYAEVTLLDLDTGNPIDEPVYLDPYGGAPQEWPILVDPAVINLWTNAPLRVTVQAALPGGATFTRSGVDIVPAPAATVRSEEPVHITSADGLDGDAMLGISPDGTATWQVLDVLRFHEHEGDAPESTVLGASDLTDIYPDQTWLGRDPNGAQGEGTAVLGSDAHPNGDEAVILGRATAGTQAVVAGAAATSLASGVVLGAGGNAQQVEQVLLGRNASGAVAGQSAVVVGSGVAGVAGDSVAIAANARITQNGSVIIGHGALPDLSWLGTDPYVALTSNTVTGRFFAARRDAVLGGTASPVGLFGTAGSYQPLVNSSSVTTSTPGRTALLSLLSALDQLGLVYLTDGAIDDELADWTKTVAHDPNLVLETGDGDGSKAGDVNRVKRNAAGTGWVTYLMPTGIRDFRARVFSWQLSGPAPATLATEVLVEVSPNNTTWTTIPLSWQAMAATTASWYQTWLANARPVPPGMKYLRLTLQVNSAIFTPQLGRVLIRSRKDPLTGFGSGTYGSGPFGG